MNKEISRRVGMSWNVYNRFTRIFRSKDDIEKKIKLWKIVTLLVLIYGCEACILTKEIVNRLSDREKQDRHYKEG